MEEQYQGSAQPAMAYDLNRHMATMAEKSTMGDKEREFTPTRKHEIIMLGESIVEQVKAAKVRGRERCFLKSVVELLIES